jgi:uncharacterized repeat protein (TIGR01451 family)
MVLNKKTLFRFLISAALALLLGWLIFGSPLLAHADAILTVEPITWNVVGLDSNNVNVGPNNFPVGVRVCNNGDAPATNVVANFVWDSLDAYIDIRTGSLNPITTSTLAAGTCSDFYFEIEITRDANAYDHRREYHIEVSSTETSTISTPTPREIYVEHLISQSRNSTTDVKLGIDSIPPGGTMTLMLGETYDIQLVGSTATNGYEQIESYINFPNTIFQINSVTSTYTANSGTDLDAASKVYADGCSWENDPNSPNYRSCLSTGKYGGNITVTYNVTIIGGAGTSETLNTLIYDFSGSSYHYNSDFSVAGRIAQIVNASIDKSFSPKTITPVGTSTLTFTINNPGKSAISNLNFTDTLPGGVGGVEIEGTTVTYAGCGSPTPASLTDGDQSLSFSNIIVAAFSTCTIEVTVTATTESLFTNTTGNLFIDTTDTGANAADILQVSSLPPASDTCDPGTRLDLATWTMPTSGQGSGGPPPPYTTIDADVSSAVASAALTGAGSQLISTAGVTTNAWQITDAWESDKDVVPGVTTPPYIQFSIDTSNYSGARILFQHELVTNQQWGANNNNFVYIYSSTDGTNFNLAGSIDTVKGSWQPLAGSTAVDTGVATTWFRITAKTRGNQPVASLLLDNITIDGCPRPEAPRIAKAFGANSILTGTTTTLSFSIYNPNVATTLTGVQFTDTLPAGVDVADSSSTECGGGTLTTTDNDPAQDTVELSGGSLTAGETCTFSVIVTGTTTGLKQNSVTVASTNGGTGNTAYANLLVRDSTPGLSFLKQVGPANSGPWSTFLAIAVSDPVYYRFVVENTGDVNLTNVDIAETTPIVPAGLDVSNCVWEDGDGDPLTAPFTLPVADASDDDHIAYCVLGSVAAQVGSHANTAEADSDQTAPIASTATYATTELALDKSASPLVYNNAGDTISYSYLVTNTGYAPLQGPVTVADDHIILPDTVTCPAVNTVGNNDNFLDPAESLTCTATYTITAGDVSAGSVTNTATASTDDVDSNDDSETVNIATPGISLTKTITSGDPYSSVGDVLNYSLQVTNSGNVTLNGPFTVADDRATDESCPPTATLAPGASITCTASYTVTQADLDAGSVTNTATASGSFGGNPVTSGPDSETATATQSPALNVTKSETSSGPYGVGDTITYDIDVLNTGNVTLTGVTVTDPDTTVGVCAPVQPGTLAPGATMTCPASYVVTQADVDAGSFTNTATGDSNETGPDTGSETITFAQNPSLNVTKTESSAGPYGVGDTITYDIDVLNTGNVTLTGVTVSDPDTTVGVCAPVQPGTLAPGATMTCPASYVVTQADVDAGSFTNTATGDSNETGPGTGSETVTFTQSPSLNVTKSETSSGPYGVGDTITYDIDVLNTGNVTLTGVAVTDPDTTVGACTPAQPGSLAPGATMTCPANYVVTQADVDVGSFTNTATGDSNETGPDTGSETITFAQNPSLNVTKSETSSSPYVVADTITYDIDVLNTGNVTLTGVTASDPDTTVGVCAPVQPGSLAPGATMTCPASYVVTQADVDAGSFTNTATGDSNETGPDTGSETVTFAQSPAISILKEVSVDGGSSWQFTVTNSGNVTLSNVGLSDTDMSSFFESDLTTPCTIPGSLAPGGSFVCFGTLTWAAGQHTDTATGSGDFGASTYSETDDANYFGGSPGLTLAKSETTTGPYNSVGDVIDYELVATNSGNVGLTNVTISDPTVGALTCVPVQPAALAVSASMTCTGSYTITQVDMDSGSVTNTGTADSDETGPETDSVTVVLTQSPSLNVTKSETSSGPYVVGDTITYDIDVLNTGNVTLTGVTVTDPDTTVGVCAPVQPASLAPGATMTCPASYVVTQTDVDAGSFTNTATGDSNETGPDTGSETVTFTQSPSLNVTKSETSSGPYGVGDTITYDIVRRAMW